LDVLLPGECAMTISGGVEAVAFTPLIEVGVRPERALVHEHGWQSWTPTTTYRLGAPPHRPSSEHRRVMSWRPDRVAPADAYQGEGLLVVDPGDGSPAHRLATFDPRGSVPSIRAEGSGDRVVVSATGPVRHDLCPGGVHAALVGWAEELAKAAGLRPGSARPTPTMWCSWYGYQQEITDRVILDNADDIERLDLPVDVVQIDDGYQREIGDWTSAAPSFGSLRALADELLARGRRVGIWTAPFLVGERSDLARRHPEWLVGDTDLGAHWDQRLFALDVTHPAAADHLRSVFAGFRDMGIDVFKLDFLYAGAVAGRRRSPVGDLDAYHAGMALIREAVGPDSYVIGCGAPIIPSVGHVDAMRVSNDIAPHWEHENGDLALGGGRGAVMTGAARAFQHGRLWVNDADCVLAAPRVERREQWAAHVRAYGGLRASGDRLADLDEWGIAVTRELLSTAPPATPFTDP
jgi:alpha-galactosidase